MVARIFFAFCVVFGKKKETFRKAALEKLSSPERLDELMAVTSPKGWVALVACGVLLGLVVVWSIVGKIPERVMAQGILIPGGALMQVESNTEGRIVEFLVKVGDLVDADQALARINVEGQDFDLDLLNQRLDRLMAQNESLSKAEQTEMADEKVRIAEARRSLDSEQKAKERTLTEARRNLGVKRTLKSRGAVSGAELKRAEVEVANAEAALQDALSRFSSLDAEESRLATRIFQQRSDRQKELDDVREQIKKSSRDKEKSETVKSPFSGRVTDIVVAEGSRVAKRDVVLRLERLDEELRALLYVPSKPGKKVEIADKVHIAPSTVKKEEFGAIVGKVSDKRTQPATPSGMLKDLGNQKLVEEFSAQGAPLRFEAFLNKDEATFSKYEWTSGKGPSVEVFSGTPCSATIIVDEKRPIEFVIPYLKEFFMG